MNVRPIAPADFPALATVAAEDETAINGRPSRLGADDVADWLSRTDLERDSWLFEEDAAVVAFGWLSVRDGVGTFAGVVAQGRKGRGLGAEIVRRAEEGARGRAARIHAFGLAEDAAAADLFTGRGYAEVRRFYEMAIELGEPPPSVPELDAGLVLEPFREEQARAFFEALDEAFQDHWEWHPTPYGEWWEMRRHSHRDEHGPLWFVVRDGGELAAVVRNEANRNGGGFVGALGVRRPWRGRGLAKALLLKTFAEFHRRGLTRVTLGVDADSPTGATHLYERVGMEVESCMVVYEKAAP